MANISQPPTKTYLPFRGVKNDPTLYTALDASSREIRYVDLHPGSGDDPVVCSLGYATLDPGRDDRPSYSIDPEANVNPSYEALSYCWGCIDDIVPITLRGSIASGTRDVTPADNFRVTRNLREALQALRYGSGTVMRRMWIDAISINQMDDREKTHQVGQMNLIYTLASRVVVWLGVEDSDSSYAFRYHQKLQAALPATPHARPTLLSSYSAELRTLKRSVSRAILEEIEANTEPLPLAEMEGYHVPREASPAFVHHLFSVSVENLLGRPWFRRIWVYPEVFLAPQDRFGNRLVTVVVGPHAMRWVDFVQLVRAAVSQPFSYKGIADPSNVNSQWFQRAWDFDNETLSKMAMSKCIYTTRDFLASDPRDKIYALLHLAQDTRDHIYTDSRLMPEYEKPLLDIILKYVGIGIMLVSEVNVSPYPEMNTLIRLDFGLTGRVLLGDDHIVIGRKVACVERFLGPTKVRILNVPSECQNTFRATNGRTYAVNCFLAPKDEVIACHITTNPFVITPYPLKEKTYLVRGPCLCYPLADKDGRMRRNVFV